MHSNLINDLRRDGIYCPQEPILSKRQLSEFRQALDQSLFYGSHVSGKSIETPVSFSDAVTNRNWKVFAPTMADVIKAPHWLETAIAFLPYAKEYFDGALPRLYSINAFWTSPGEIPRYKETQSWHRDGDAPKQFTIFMFGTDVFELSDGAHLYQKGTHLIPSDDDLAWHHLDDPPEGVTRVVLGSAGTGVIVDTNGLHKGLIPINKPRLLVWARYSTSRLPVPESYKWDSLSPVLRETIGDRYPTDPEVQESIRLVVS